MSVWQIVQLPKESLVASWSIIIQRCGESRIELIAERYTYGSDLRSPAYDRHRTGPHSQMDPLFAIRNRD